MEKFKKIKNSKKIIKLKKDIKDTNLLKDEVVQLLQLALKKKLKRTIQLKNFM